MDKVFSNLELLVITNLQGEIKITDLANKVYKGRKKKPLNPNISVTSAIKNINKKCKLHKYTWHIGGDAGLGREGKTVWYVKKG